jgi:hypothetical protein
MFDIDMMKTRMDEFLKASMHKKFLEEEKMVLGVVLICKKLFYQEIEN